MNAQKPAKEQSKEPRRIITVMPFVGGYLPHADFSSRFGPFGEAGLNVTLRTKNNWLIGLEGGLLFTNKINEDVLGSLRTAEGFLIDQEGGLGEAQTDMRGMRLPMLRFGRLLPVGKNSKYMEEGSGVELNLGLGWLTHYVLIQDLTRSIPQIRDEYRKGYDRYTNGLMTSQMVAFRFIDKGHTLNFYLGVEFWQGHTISRRFNFDLGFQDNRRRLDAGFGLRAGYMLNFFSQRTVEEFTY